MKKIVAKIGEGIERNAWISDSGNYRVLDTKGLGYWTRNRYVVQIRTFNIIGQELWMCCRYGGAILGSMTISQAKQFAYSAEKDGVSWE